MPRRILIADDSPVIRRTIRSWIEAKTDCEVCGEAGDGKTAVRLVDRLRPDTSHPRCRNACNDWASGSR